MDSTNTWVLGEARRGAAAGLVCVADVQTAGRGRLGRTWESPSGNLLCSVLLRPAGGPSFLDVARVALAGRDAARDAAAPVAVGLKWPNDLVVDGVGKLAGVLAEVDAGAVVVGIGMNVAWAPEGAACLGDGFSRDGVLAALLASLSGWLSVGDREVLSAYRAACMTLGRDVRVELADESFTGRAADITDSGALLVDVGVCIREVSAADVVHLR